MSTKRPTLGDSRAEWDRWVERYVNRLDALQFSKSTVDGRRRLLNLFGRYAREMGVHGPEGIGPGILRAYLFYRREASNSMGRKDSPNTLNLHFLAVRKFLEFLSLEGLVPEKLVRAIEYVKVPRGLPKDIPTDAEVRRILATADLSRTTGFRDRAILEFMYSTAMRRQEVADVRMEDVDFSERFVRIESGKGGKGRVVPLGRVAGEWLRAYLLAVRSEMLRSKPDPGWLFVTKSGNKMDGNMLREVVVKAAKRAGIKDKRITPHALRRACATEMIKREANVYMVKELLGHADLSTMDAYVKLLIVDLKEAHRKYHHR